jgi:membrane-associated phospholipid phosphatase
MTKGLGSRFAVCTVVGLLVAVPARAQSLAPSGSLPTATTTPTTFTGITPPPATFGNLFKDLGGDFSRIPSRENLLIVAFGGLAAGVAHPFDARVSRSLTGATTLKGPFSAGQAIGGAAAQVAGAFAANLVGRATGNARMTAIGSDLLRAQIVAQTMTMGVKFAVQRERPDGTQYSFPSGHTASAFAMATVLHRDLGWKAGVPAYAVASYVAASRIEVNRHYLSDVALGAALGIVAGRSVTIGHGDARFAVAPTGVPGGAGVNFTWVGHK